MIEEDTDVQSVEQVYTITKTEEVSETDSFAQPSEILKSYSGVSTGTRRKVTGQLQKYNRSADHSAESKQITDVGIITGYDTFGVVQPPHNLDSLVSLYEMSSPHYAAVNAKVANIVGLGYKLIETNKTKRAMELIDEKKKLDRVRKKFSEAKDDLQELIEGLNEEQSLTEVLVAVWRDYEVTGNGYIEIGRRRDGTIGYIGHIQAQTIRIRRNRDGFVQISGNKVQFFRNFGDNVTNSIGTDSNPNEIIHFKKYSPTSAFYGIPDIVAAQQAIAGNEFSSRYNLDYFENKAVPRHVITIKGAKLSQQAISELLAFFETGLKGQNHRSLFIPLPSDDVNRKVEFNIEPIEAGIQDSSFNNYRKINLNEILMVHRVPISKVSVAEGASLALARDADKTFKEQVCSPEQRVANKKINRIVKELTDAFEFQLNEMTLTDEDTQSKIDERDRKAGIITPNEVRVARGLPTIEGGDELFDLNLRAKGQNSPLTEATTNRERDAARSAGATDNNGEARSPQGEGRAVN